MILSNEKYKINITTYKEFFSKNNKSRDYDFVYGLEKLNIYYDKNCDTTLSVTVYSDAKCTKIALTGEYYSYDENCAVLEDDVLTVLQNTTVTQLDLRTFQRIVSKNIDECFFGFEIYKVEDFYILYGETEIIRLDKNLNCVWTFGGADIFVTTDNSPTFVLGENTIRLKDWQGNCYVIDFDGKEIK